MSSPRILVTAASGQLGRLVVARLLARLPASEIAVGVRDPASVADLAAFGVSVRHVDYTQPSTLDAAFTGIERLLLISSNALGQREAQHRNVIDAAKRAGVALVAYTSVLHADTSPLGLAAEHRQTEAALRESGLGYVLLRNGWYTENLTASLGHELASGTRYGSAGQGGFSSASREDYAEAAAVVLSSDGQAGKIYELAGDTSYTLDEYVAEISRLSGKHVAYQDLPQADYRAALVQAGLPEFVADLLSDSDAGAAKGGLYDDSRQLSTLIGRPTTPLTVTLQQALAAI